MVVAITMNQFAAKLDQIGDGIGRAAVRGVRGAARRLQVMVVEELHQRGAFGQLAPNDTGELQRSVRVIPEEDGATVLVDAPHAPFIEYGTRPHFPPIEPLAEWAYRKGIADSKEEAEEIALSIARKIAAHGTLPYAYFARALHEFKRTGVLEEEVKREINRYLGD